MVSLANGYPTDEMKEKGLGKKIDFDSRMRSWVAGFSYDFHTSDDKFLNSVTTRYYWYRTNTCYQNIYVNIPPEEITLNKSSLGLSDAMRYRFTPAFMAKLSGGYDVRIPISVSMPACCTMSPAPTPATYRLNWAATTCTSRT